MPVSSVTSAPRSSFAARSSSPSRRTSSPRRGAGTSRHTSNAACARRIAASVSAADDDGDAGDHLAGDRRAHLEVARLQRSRVEPEPGEDCGGIHGRIVPRADALPSRTVRAAPLIFLVLWSGGYAAAKVALPYTGPMTLLALRYAIAIALLAPALFCIKQPEWPRTRPPGCTC